MEGQWQQEREHHKVMCLYVWVCVCVFRHIRVHMHAEVIEQCQANYSAPYVLRSRLSLNLQVTNWARLAAQ